MSEKTKSLKRRLRGAKIVVIPRIKKAKNLNDRRNLEG